MGDGIFISYRRDDSAPYARLISDALCARFGEQAIFRDIDTIRPGTNFVEAIEEAVSSCDALVVVIGKDWVTISDSKGQRRLDDLEDYVRREVLAGLRRDDVLVVPVLVEGARMPGKDELPPELVPLSLHMALELTDAGWDDQVNRLVQVLTEAIGPEVAAPSTTSSVAPPSAPPVAPPTGSRSLSWIAGALAGACVALLLLVLVVREVIDPASSGGARSTSTFPTLSVSAPPPSTASGPSAPPTTSPPLQTLVERAGSGYTVLVPEDWRRIDVPTTEPGAPRAEVWTDPVDPNRSLRVTASTCTACATTGDGSPEVGQLIPQPNVVSKRISRTFATYETYEAGNPLKNNGSVRIHRSGSDVKGYYRLDLWLPGEMHKTATDILNSFRGSF